jgi:OFA family oxalate/formate antiporter-like MFS transporter
MSESADTRVRNRWLVVLGAVVIQLCLGAIYAWSVFTPYLIEAPFAFTKTQTQVIFSVSLASFALTMILAGRWQARSGPRIVALTGGLVLGAGYILAGLLKNALFGHYVNQILFVGLVAGIGIGLAYVCPIAVGMRWFPDKKGLITGLAVAGFGFGALIWIQLAGEFGGLLESIGVSGVFTLYGAIFAVAISVGSIWMVNPPAGWRPAGMDSYCRVCAHRVGCGIDAAQRDAAHAPVLFDLGNVHLLCHGGLARHRQHQVVRH